MKSLSNSISTKLNKKFERNRAYKARMSLEEQRWKEETIQKFKERMEKNQIALQKLNEAKARAIERSRRAQKKRIAYKNEVL